MDSDAVSTYNETIESEQIALTAQEQYMELATYQRVPQFEQLTKLITPGSTPTGSILNIPALATDVYDIRYRHIDSNDNTTYRAMKFLSKTDFLNQQLDLKVGEDNVEENTLSNGVKIPFRTDKSPEYYTTFDDETIVFDSIDSIAEGGNSIDGDNSLAIAYIIPEFELEDNFIPDLPIKLFPQYLDMIKEVNSYEQRQFGNEIRTKKAERQSNRNRHFASITDGSDQGEYTTAGGKGRNRYYRGRRISSSTGLPRV